jgi:hypothetical protein
MESPDEYMGGWLQAMHDAIMAIQEPKPMGDLQKLELARQLAPFINPARGGNT